MPDSVFHCIHCTTHGAHMVIGILKQLITPLFFIPSIAPPMALESSHASHGSSHHEASHRPLSSRPRMSMNMNVCSYSMLLILSSMTTFFSSVAALLLSLAAVLLSLSFIYMMHTTLIYIFLGGIVPLVLKYFLSSCCL